MRTLSRLIFITSTLLFLAACGGDDPPAEGSCSSNMDCDDGNLCNGAESCVLGMCGQGTPVDNGTTCMLDSASGVCFDGTCAESNCGDGFLDPNGTEECDDGNTSDGDGCDNSCEFSCEMDVDCDNGMPCDGSEVCDTATHTCQPGTAVDCRGMDDDCNTYRCAAADGSCEPTPRADGIECDDTDPCTEMETCTAGTCGGPQIDCTAVDDQCNVGICDSASGTCGPTPVVDGIACNDADPTTNVDTCQMGVCVGDNPGHVVFIGHDYSDSNESIDALVGNSARLANVLTGHLVLIGHDYFENEANADRIVGNAVLLANTTGTINVVEYTQYADATAGSELVRIRNAVDARLTEAGRSARYSAVSDYTRLDLSSANVLLIPEQELAGGNPAQLDRIAGALNAQFNEFLNRGGVIVACDFLNTTARLVNSRDLFEISGAISVTGIMTTISDPTSPLTEGIVPYRTPDGSSGFPGITGGDIIVTAGAADAPVVVHQRRRHIQVASTHYLVDVLGWDSESFKLYGALNASFMGSIYRYNLQLDTVPETAELPNLTNADVLLIPEMEMAREAEDGARVGAAWSSSLVDFVRGGGVIISAGHAANAALLNSARVLPNMGVGRAIAAETTLDVVAPTDPVAPADTRGYSAAGVTMALQTTAATGGTNVVAERRAVMSPVVVHRTY